MWGRNVCGEIIPALYTEEDLTKYNEICQNFRKIQQLILAFVKQDNEQVYKNQMTYLERKIVFFVLCDWVVGDFF